MKTRSLAYMMALASNFASKLHSGFVGNDSLNPGCRAISQMYCATWLTHIVDATCPDACPPMPSAKTYSPAL